MCEIDTFLQSNICTYHQIIKNSVLKQVNSGDLFRLEAELSYFRNLSTTTRRQRRQLELSIRQKLHILHSDWKTFVENQYPELSKSLAQSELMTIENSSRLQQKNEFQTNKAKAVEVVDNVMAFADAHDDQNFNIHRLLENSRQFAVQKLRVPQLKKLSDLAQQNELAKKMNDNFQQKIEKVFQNFADFKINSNQFDYEEEHLNDVYCKLISKKILLLIQVPSSQLFYKTIQKEGCIEVTYYLFDQSMIRVPQDCFQ